MIKTRPPQEPDSLYSAQTSACQILQGGPNLYLMVACTLVGMAPSPLLCWALLESGYADWIVGIGFILGLILWLPGFFVGVFLADWLDKRILKLSGIALFNAHLTPVTLSENGLQIEGLGLSPRAEIQEWGEYSDSSNYLTITTRQFGLILLAEDPERIFPILESAKAAYA
ncbi:MAG: hypothetical protein V4812_14725 [Pseudomonadota bacterium]